MAGFPSVADVVTLLKADEFEEAKETQVDMLLDFAISEFKTLANNNIENTEYEKQKYIERTKTLTLGARPITEIKLFKINDADVNGEDYILEAALGVIKFKVAKTGTVKINFSAGYEADDIPNDIRKAILFQVIDWINKVEDRLGKKSVSIGGETQSFLTDSVLPEFLETAKRYEIMNYG